jgi:hypothetical protein
METLHTIKLTSAVTRLNNSSIDITETYEHWFQIACAFANEFEKVGISSFSFSK